MHATDERPLITMAAERTREIHARCVTVERACAAIGFAPGSCYDRVATLIARVAGESILRRTAAEISKDSAVGFSVRHVQRAIEKLQEFGVIECEDEPAPQWHQVGRPPKYLRLRIRWDHVRSVVAAADKWRHSHAETDVQNEPAELSTSNRHPTGTQPADSRHSVGIQAADDRRLADRSYLYPYSPLPSSPSSLDASAGVPAGPADDDGEGHREELPTASPVGEPARSSATAPAVTEALAAAGVERTRSLLAEADRRRITAAELIDAAYVCRHWSGLTPGALFDWVRSGGWPASGVPPADVLRHERRKAAEAIRSRVQADASERTPQPPECVVAAVTCRRLRATNAKGCKTDLGDECTPEELRGEAEATSNVDGAKTRACGQPFLNSLPNC